MRGPEYAGAFAESESQQTPEQARAERRFGEVSGQTEERIARTEAEGQDAAKAKGMSASMLKSIKKAFGGPSASSARGKRWHGLIKAALIGFMIGMGPKFMEDNAQSIEGAKKEVAGQIEGVGRLLDDHLDQLQEQLRKPQETDKREYRHIYEKDGEGIQSVVPEDLYKSIEALARGQGGVSKEALREMVDEIFDDLPEHMQAPDMTITLEEADALRAADAARSASEAANASSNNDIVPQKTFEEIAESLDPKNKP